MSARIRRFLLIGWLTLVAGVAVATPQPATLPVLLVMGDSLSAGYGLHISQAWPSLLAARLQGRYRVINASQSGETTAGGLAKFPAQLQAHRPAIVLLQLGANDGLQGLPLPKAQENLRRMIHLSRQSGARVLLLGMQLPPNYGKAFGQKFVVMYQQLARSENVALVPFLLDGFAGRQAWFQPDQLHPVAAAQPVILETVWGGLEPLLQPVVGAASRPPAKP
jgi:acyl-CoA thioesterase-1